MRNFRLLSLAAALSGVFAGVATLGACTDGEEIVRTRSDGGVEASFDGPVEGGGNTLACGLPIPASYDSPMFASNAAAELTFEKSVHDIDAAMKAAEVGDGGAPANLQALFTAGSPSLRSIATAFAQSTIDTYLTQFNDSVTRSWTPADAEADGGAAAGGKYDGASVFSATGTDLRAATEKVLINGSLYNYALVLAGGPMSQGTIDRLLAVYGASTKLAAKTDRDGGTGADIDQLAAAYASQRDNPTSATFGPYRKIRGALLVARAASSDTEHCRADLDAALKIYFLEWEKATYLSVIYYLYEAQTNALVTPVTTAKSAAALHAFGSAIGFAQSFKGIPQDRRKITDAQIDALLTRIGTASAYQLITRTGDRVVAFSTATQEIGAIYGLSQIEIEDAKKAY